MTIQRFQSLRPEADLQQFISALGTKKPSNGLTPQGGWYAIKNLSESESEISIYDDIGEWGISAADFIRDIGAIKSRNIMLRINSGGGSVFDGVAIFNAIRRHPANVTAYIDGIAASAASFVAMAADKVVMSPHSTMMIHEASGGCIGNAADMRDLADRLDMLSDTIASIYAERSGGTTEEWRARMKTETWMTDREAVSMGLADGIDGEDEPEYRRDTIAASGKPAIDFAALINQQMEDAAVLVA